MCTENSTGQGLRLKEVGPYKEKLKPSIHPVKRKDNILSSPDAEKNKNVVSFFLLLSFHVFRFF